MRIILFCALGMSTSLLVESMKKAAERLDQSIEIEAHSVDEFDTRAKNADVALLGPQIRYKKQALLQKTEAMGLPLEIIDAVAYGTINGEKVLQQALQLVETKK